MASSHKAELLKQVDAELRAELRAQRKAVAAYLREVKQRRAAAVARARAQCKASKARAAERAKQIRERYRAQANAEVQDVRRAAKRACDAGLAKARKRGRKDETAAEQRRRRALADEKLLTQKRDRKAPRSSKKELAAESDDEVTQNLDSHLVPVWRAVARRFKARPRISRTEQFLQWVEENPDEVLALQFPDQADIEREAAAELARLDRALKKGRLSARDWSALGTSPAELEAVGLRPDDPEDVAAFLGGYTQHWQDMTADVPF